MSNIKGKKLSLDWHSIGLFCTAFFLLMTVLTAFIIVPHISASFEENIEMEAHNTLTLEADLFERFIDHKKALLEDLASYPSLISAVMLSSAKEKNLIDYFNNIQIDGKKAKLIVQDIGKNVLLSSVPPYQSDFPGADAVLSGNTPYHFALIDQEGDIFTFQLSVPIRYQGYIEGLLSAQMEASLSDLLRKNTQNIALKLSQKDVLIQTSLNNIKIPYESKKEFDNIDLTFSVITDNAPWIEKSNILRNTILSVLLVGLIISFIFFIIFEYRKLVDKSLTEIKYIKYLTPHYLLLSIVGSIGIAVSIVGFIILKDMEHNKTESAFYTSSKAAIQSIKERLHDVSDVLRSLKAFYDASDFITREEFSEFTLPLLKQHPNIQALEWVPYVPHAKRHAYEERVRQDGFASFTFIDKNAEGRLIPAPDQEEYYPVYYLEPFKENKIVLGLAPTYHPDRRQTIYNVRDSGKMLSTNPTLLTQNHHTKLGYLTFSPVYHGKASYDTEQARKKNIKGYVLLVSLVERIIDSALQEEKFNTLNFHIEDITDSHEHYTLYESKAKITEKSTFTFSTSLDYTGRQWKVSSHLLTDNLTTTFIPFLVLIGGIFLTIFVVFFLMHLIRRREMVEALVKERTAELKMINDLVANSNDVFILTKAHNLHKDGPEIIYVNNAFERMTGFTKEEVIGKTPRILQGEKTDRTELTRIKRALEQAMPYHGDLLNYTKDDKEYWVNITIWPIFDEDGKLIQFGAVKKDITSFKQEEKKALELGQAMRLAVEGISKIDTQGNYIYINNAYASKIGYTPEELIGKNWEITVLNDEIDKMKNAYQTMLQDGKIVAETIGQHKDGSRLHKRVTMIVDQDDNGQFIGHFCFMQDISERKKIEMEREDLIEKLVESNDELERFAFVCSHDLQEPLRMIRSFSERLKKHMGDTFEHDEKGKKYFHFITDNAIRAQNLIADILDYARINNGNNKIETFFIGDLIETIKENMMIEMSDNKIQITCDPLPNIQANKTQILQLFQNVINNGIKYQAGGHMAKIHVSFQNLEDYWQFSIKDNGIGIESRHFDKIFDVFKRLHSKQEYTGTGVGLAICKKVVEKHKGKIWVESQKDVGSTFFFTILKSMDIKDEHQYG